jgi:hypothetical protein
MGSLLKIKAQKNGMLYSLHNCIIGLDFQRLSKKLVSNKFCPIRKTSLLHYQSVLYTVFPFSAF